MHPEIMALSVFLDSHNCLSQPVSLSLSPSSQCPSPVKGSPYTSTVGSSEIADPSESPRLIF